MKVSFWLVPADPYRTELFRSIGELAARFDAPRFTPHVTIFSGEVDSTVSTADILATVSSTTCEIQLLATGMGISPEFTRTLFIAFEENAELSRLAKRIRTLCFPSQYELHPHLSLVYASIDEADKRELAAKIRHPAVVSFDTIQAVATGETTRSRSDIEVWKVIAEARLSPRQP